MKKCMYFKLLYVFVGMLFLCTCSDEEYYGNYGDGYASDLNRLYSNKSIHPDRNGNLVLTYSGGLMLGKEIFFEMATASTARMKFFDVFPGEREVLVEPFQLVNSETGYSFTTKSVTPKGTAFELTGCIEKGKLQVALNHVKMPDNIFSQQGTFEMMKYQEEYLPGENGTTNISFNMAVLMDWYYRFPGGEEEKVFFSSNGDFSALVQAILSQLVFLVLPDVTFNADGNIIANYASLSDDFNILYLIMGGVNEEHRGEVQTSPANLIHYYVRDNSVYITPNIDMILHTIQTNKTRAAEEGDVETALDLGKILLAIMEAYPSIQKWCTEGICFKFKENNPNEGFIGEENIFYFFRGDYQLYLDEKELKPLLSLFPLIMEFIDLDIDEEISGILELLFGFSVDEIFKRISYTSSLKLGLYLNTEN